MKIKKILPFVLICYAIGARAENWQGLELNPLSMTRFPAISAGYNYFNENHGFEVSVPVLYRKRKEVLFGGYAYSVSNISAIAKKYIQNNATGTYMSFGVRLTRLWREDDFFPDENREIYKPGIGFGIGYRKVVTAFDHRHLYWGVSAMTIFHFGRNNVFGLDPLLESDDDASQTYDVELFKFGVEL